MRVFVGIPASKKIQERILEWQTGFATKEAAKNLIRFIEQKNLHVTLVPPWEISNWEEAGERLKKVIGNPFEIRFSQIVFGPNSREPRLIWASGIPGQEIGSLKSAAYKVLGQTPDARPFKLHLTLARFRFEDFNHFKTKQLNETINWSQQAESFALYESRLLPGGADYRILQEYKL